MTYVLIESVQNVTEETLQVFDEVVNMCLI